MENEAKPFIREKDLRLAVVCFGGISLAVYQHGITKEIIKLLRASKIFHAEDGSREFDINTKPDTELLYLDLLDKIRKSGLNLRIIVDAISGSSAGGINGVVLARAISHDLPVEPLTDMWLTRADIAHVLAARARARPWHKWYIRPFVAPIFWLLTRKHLMPSIPDKETRTKLSLFLRSQWFRPPFDGQGFCHILLDALGAMGEPRSRTASLMPAGHRLDLLITATDFYGTDRSIYIHDPPVVREREHRHIFRFSFEKFKGGGIQTDFDTYSVPSLAFAARATASFPGAFPPVQIDEMDAALNARQQSWPGREQFLRDNFTPYHAFGINPERAVFVDGSVLNNKPVFEAIEAASSHAAFRGVDRRLIYIDPHPGAAKPPPEIVPGFARTIAGALSELPRYEPIFGELAQIEVFNANVRRLQQTIDTATPRVRAVVGEVLGAGPVRPADAQQVRRWRLKVAHRVSTEERILYANYLQLMIGAGLEYLSQLICAVCAFPQGSPQVHWVAKTLRIWARRSGIYSENYEIEPGIADDMDLPAFARFVGSFDLGSRRRRIQLIMRTIDGLFNRLENDGGISTTPASLDALKRRFFHQLDSLREYQKNDFLRVQTLSHARALFGRTNVMPDEAALPDPQAFVLSHFSELSAIIEQIGTECDFKRFSNETDEIVGSAEFQQMDGFVRREILEAYLGFDLWDAVSFPMMSMKGSHEALQLTELQEIVVDRISPDDITAFADRGPFLRGAEFGGFAGFFSRAARENDYLWGRLHAIDRLLSIIASSVSQEMNEDLDIGSFKKRAFEIVLQAEAKRLPHVTELINELQTATTNL